MNSFSLCNNCHFSQMEALHKLFSTLPSIGKTLSLVLFQKMLQRFCKLPVANTIPVRLCGGCLGHCHF